MGIHALVIYFTLCLLVNDWELLVFDDFLWELLLLKFIFSKKGVYVYVWGVSFVSMLF